MKMPLTLLLVLTFESATGAQHQVKQESSFIRSLGFSLGYADAYLDERIRDHLGIAGFVEFSLGERMLLKVQLGYFQTNKSLSGVEFQYKDNVYVAQRPQVWKNWSLDGILLWKVTERASVGVGGGAEVIRVRRISYNSYQVFWVDFLTDTPYVIPSTIVDETESLVRPSMSFVSRHEWELSGSVFLDVGLHYKISFVGAKYGYTVLNSQNTYGVSIGLKYRL